jgi:cytosine/adenosine deaminase-related metal-dependent hydrolase
MGAAIPTILKSYNLLGPDIILSHGTGSTDDEFKLMKDEGVKISCTPSTESQMAHGDLVGFRSDVLGSLGSDCKHNNHTKVLKSA